MSKKSTSSSSDKSFRYPTIRRRTHTLSDDEVDAEVDVEAMVGLSHKDEPEYGATVYVTKHKTKLVTVKESVSYTYSTTTSKKSYSKSQPTAVTVVSKSESDPNFKSKDH